MAGSELSRPPPWRQLHGLSVAVNLFPRIGRGLTSLWPLALAIVYGGVQREFALMELALAVLFLGMPIIGVVVHWATLRYRMEDGNLVIRTGLLNRQIRTLPPARIQNVESHQNVFHRLAGLVELRIETASGEDVEGLLSALDVGEAQRLIRALRGRTTEERAPRSFPLVETSLPELALAGLTAPRWGLLLALGGLWFQRPFGLDATLPSVSWIQGLGLGVGAVFVVWAFGGVQSVMVHYGFVLEQQGGRLVASSGLFTRRSVELHRSKIQVVSWVEPLLRRMMSAGSVRIGTAAAHSNTGGIHQAETVLPWLDVRARDDVLRDVMIRPVPPLETLPFRPPDVRAFYRAFLRSLTWMAVSGGLGFAWAGSWGLGFALIGVFNGVTEWLDLRHQGFWMSDEHLVSRMGWWVRSTRLVALSKLQSVSVVQGPIERRWNLARVYVRAAGVSVALPMLPWEQALDVEQRLIQAAERLSVPILPLSEPPVP